MDVDLISRAAVLRMLDENGVVFRGEIEKMPAVDAVPVAWLEEQRDKLSEAWDEEWHVINGLIEQWHEEQEAGE